MCILCPIATKIAGNKLILLISNMHQFFISMCTSSRMSEFDKSEMSDNLIEHNMSLGSAGRREETIHMVQALIHS